MELALSVLMSIVLVGAGAKLTFIATHGPKFLNLASSSDRANVLGVGLLSIVWPVAATNRSDLAFRLLGLSVIGCLCIGFLLARLASVETLMLVAGCTITGWAFLRIVGNLGAVGLRASLTASLFLATILAAATVWGARALWPRDSLTARAVWVGSGMGGAVLMASGAAPLVALVWNAARQTGPYSVYRGGQYLYSSPTGDPEMTQVGVSITWLVLVVICASVAFRAGRRMQLR
ncbi:MAG: hypothetical protein IPJ15_06305 [Actinomycetales bacterium]|jgi:hypothetical protein|nr:hypothetical protein [Candidatus Phosphoribacter baldrii]